MKIMKKTILIFLISILLFSLKISAQEATTNWPYLYNDFKNGTVNYTNGAKNEALMNIHLLRSRLHYLDNGIIKEVSNTDILVIEIGTDKYFAHDGKMYRVFAGNKVCFLGELATADISALNVPTGAYGSSSSTQSTKKLTSIDLSQTPYVNPAQWSSTSHIELKNNKEGGDFLPIIKKYYIVSCGEIFLATKKGIESNLSDDKISEFNDFVKKHKIKWRSPESLAKLLEFFGEE